jgi:hypothetical protein
MGNILDCVTSVAVSPCSIRRRLMTTEEYRPEMKTYMMPGMKMKANLMVVHWSALWAS